MTFDTPGEDSCVGLVGLGPMGRGLAENLSLIGVGVVAWDKNFSVISSHGNESHSNFRVLESISDFAQALKPPRTILLSVPSGVPVDDVIDELIGQLSSGDVIADCGNSYFKDTARRALRLKDAGLSYLGLGVSGGPEGARTGPSIMAGGDEYAWSLTRPLLEAIAAKVDGVSCCGYHGEGGAGHFVKMVHNGIEYAVMQLLMEVYAVLKPAKGANQNDVLNALMSLNAGINESYLLGATATVIAKHAPGENRLLLDIVSGAVGHKGTGQWSVKTALEQGEPVPTLAEAVMYRFFSGKDNQNYRPADHDPEAALELADCMSHLPGALTVALISSFAQGHAMFGSCESSLGHRLDQKEILRTWRGGCILQSNIVEFLWLAAQDQIKDGNLLNWPQVQIVVEKNLHALRAVVAASANAGIPCPGLASALAYVESRMGARLPTEVLQLLRDYFGQHGLLEKGTDHRIDVNWHGDFGDK